MSKTSVFKLYLICTLLIGLVFGGIIVNTYYPKVIVEEIEPTTITIAVGHGYHYAMPIIMEHFDLVEKYSGGLVNLDVVALKSDACTQGVIGGSVQFTQRAGASVLKNIDDGAPFQMLISVGRKDRELWTSDPNINSIADMPEGTQICTVTPTSFASIALTVALKELDRSLDYVDLLFISHADAYQLMVTGELKFDYTGAPYTARYAREPDKYHMITTDTDILGMEMPASALHGRKDYMEENPQVVSYVVSAWLEAMDWLQDNGEEASLIVAGFYSDPLDVAYDDWLASKITFNPAFGMADLPRLSKLLYENGIISRTYTAEELVHPVGRAYP